MHLRLAFLLAAASVVSAADTPYMKPSKEVLDVMNAPMTPVMSVNPTRDYAILMRAARYPSIAEVAQPMLRLAGIRIDSNTNGMHLAPNHTGFELKRLSDGADIAMKLPGNRRLGAPVWSPDGKQFAFTNTNEHGIELWIGTTATGQTKQIGGVQLNGVHGGFGGAGARGERPGGDGTIEWLGDSRTVLVHLIPAGRGTAPAESTIPKGPHIQESLGHAGPVPTYEDMLQTPHDEDLFEYYATTQLAYLDTSSGKVTPAGKPGIYMMAQPSPDGLHLMTSRIHRPFSYQLPMGSFPQDVEVWDRKGSVEYTVAKLGLAERVAIGGVRTGPRSYTWQPTQGAALTWAEAMDGGNPKEQVPHRDRLLMISAPFKAQPHEVFKTEQRFSGMEPMEKDGLALVNDLERKKQTIRTIVVDLNKPGDEGKVIFSRNTRERYKDPGRPLLRELPNGKRVVMMEGDSILLSGEGASPTGDHPFLDRYNIATGKTERIFQARAGFETLEAVLDDSGKRFITLHESPTEPPNYFLHDGANVKPLTSYADAAPQIRGIQKQLVNYKRADGVGRNCLRSCGPTRTNSPT
jgi:dipeptidyl aminopeptidase/acylaminoacyl peptidase